jgi:hypothetical protein
VGLRRSRPDDVLAHLSQYHTGTENLAEGVARAFGAFAVSAKGWPQIGK